MKILFYEGIIYVERLSLSKRLSKNSSAKGKINLHNETVLTAKNIKLKKITAALTAVVFILLSMIAVSFLADITGSAQVTQTQIDRLRAEKREYERQKREVQSRINTIEFEHMTETLKKEVLDQRITLTDLEIRNINQIIEQYYNLIREKEYEVFLAQNREEDQLQKYRSRVRDMEENGVISYLEILFDATSFSDLLARIDFISDIMTADTKLYNDLQVKRNETEEAKADLEEIKEELEEEKEQLEQKEVELLEQLEEAHEMIRSLEADIENESQRRDQLIAEEARIQREINTAVEQLKRQQEAERLRRLREQQNQSQSGSGSSGSGSASTGESGGGGGTSGSGQFTWPVPGGKIISRWGASRGNRSHQGLDISGAHGANVVAADSGTVITVSYGSGYGNYVTISHGNGIQTLYSHLTSSAVSVGTSVSRGQVIGYVGSTGNATTPHLHFEVFVNGTRVNPEPWL